MIKLLIVRVPKHLVWGWGVRPKAPFVCSLSVQWELGWRLWGGWMGGGRGGEGELWGFTGRRPLTQMCQAWWPQLLPWAGSSNPWLFWVGRSLQEWSAPVLCHCWDESELPVVTLALARGEGGELWFETIHSLFTGDAIKKWIEDRAHFTLCWPTLTSQATPANSGWWWWWCPLLSNSNSTSKYFIVCCNHNKRKFFFTHTSSATENNLVKLS